jgi:hypothetical protein
LLTMKLNKCRDLFKLVKEHRTKLTETDLESKMANAAVTSLDRCEFLMFASRFATFKRIKSQMKTSE